MDVIQFLLEKLYREYIACIVPILPDFVFLFHSLPFLSQKGKNFFVFVCLILTINLSGCEFLKSRMISDSGYFSLNFAIK